MKRILIVAALLCGAISLSAQEKGESYAGIAIGASTGSLQYEYQLKKTIPLGTSFGIRGEIAYFPARRLRVGVAVGMPYDSTPTDESLGYDYKLYSRTIGIQVNPSIAYYAKLGERLYYTPELGGAYEIGSYYEEVGENATEKMMYSGWEVYCHFFALEYRVSDSFAIGTDVGSLVYSNAAIKDNRGDPYLTITQTKFSFNSATVHARFYF